ncbi:hypothetical protein L218DRAFT_386529 [Marasmius fiardii PR-910]|nr:hypothetical protein L218DRAFT_386529 [Marasmius fiardii PR-910]
MSTPSIHNQVDLLSSTLPTFNMLHLVPSLLHLTFKKKTNTQMDLRFSLRLSPEDRRQYRTSYMVQSLPFFNSDSERNDLGIGGYILSLILAANVDHISVFVDEIYFSLSGTFLSDLASSHSPRYLHVPPLSPVWINGMPCFTWTSTNEFFYWSSDPSGVTRIAEEDWELYGIPQLRVAMYIGSSWLRVSYHAVQDYLLLKNYNLDGVDFATRHEYPLLITGDPHVRVGKRPKLRIQRAVSWVGKKVFKCKDSSENKAKAQHLSLRFPASCIYDYLQSPDVSM